MLIDSVLMAALLAAFLYSKRIEALLAFALTYIYAYLPIVSIDGHLASLFDIHSAVMNHVVYGLIFIPFAFYARISTAIVIAIYSTFHCFVAIDYLLYPTTETLISAWYHEIQNGLAFCLLLSSLKRGYNGIAERYSCNPLFNLEHRQCGVTHQKAMEGKQ